jgi:ketosteroid isomerase-like protein
MSEQDVEVVRQAFAEFSKGVVEGNPGVTFDLGLVAPDAKWILPEGGAGIQTEYVGREGWLEFIQDWTEDFDWSIELVEANDVGDGRVVVETLQRAAGKGSGVPLEVHMGGVWTVKDGQVVLMENFFQPAEAYAAVGLSG